jgi:hypothetical protein
VSPLTDRRCIGFSFRIDESIGGSWQVILEVDDCYPFELVADGALAQVKGPFVFGLEIDARGGDGAPLATNVRETIERLCEPRSGPWARERKLRFSEAILAEGDPIEVLGTVSVSVDPRGQRESARGQPLLRLIRGTPRHPTALVDDRP